MKRYKIFKEEGGELLSFYAKGDLMGGYKEGKWCSPNKKAIEKGYGCLVFTSLVRAITMLQAGCRIARVHCRGKMELPKKLSMMQGRWFDLNKLLELFGFRTIDERGWPPNTEMYEKVKIVELLNVKATTEIWHNRNGLLRGLDLYTGGTSRGQETEAARAWSTL